MDSIKVNPLWHNAPYHELSIVRDNITRTILLQLYEM